MKCPNCQFENPERGIFCGECGAKLETVCPNCNFPNPLQFKFCGDCGHQLSVPAQPPPKELSFDEKLTKIQKYLPGGLAEKILAQRGKIEGERRQVTVMFTDLEGFTPLTERLGPEETYRLMDKIYELLIHEVYRYEGTVNEMTGDGVMALFGAPIAQEDAPQRAVRSALSIHKEMAKFIGQIKEEKGISSLKMRIGIHTGPVVVGTLGNDLRVDFKAVGDTVNLAARMQALAESGSTFISEDTYRLIEGLFRCEALGKMEIKGKSTPVAVYRVVGSGKSRSRFEARAEKGLSRFVGREREMEILRDCLERAMTGKGQAISIVADAGLGKSRVLYELKKSLRGEEVTFLEGRCLSYGQNIPYSPMIDILKDSFRIEPEDRPFEILGKLRKGLEQIEMPREQSFPYLAELLNLEHGTEVVKGMDPEIKRRKTFEALREIVLRGSQVKTLVMAFEDLHWADKTSEECMKRLVESIAGARVLLVFTFRPPYLPPCGGRSYYSQISLSRFSNRESLTLIGSLLNAEEIENALSELLLEKTEGNPFFIEEFRRSLLESGATLNVNGICRLKPGFVPIRIPETIQDVLMARVDRLPDEARSVLQTGAVIEREFKWELIKEATGLSEMELLSQLSLLKESELIFERGIFPRVSYFFQHGMTRDLLYESLLTDKRKELHLAVGTAMERLYAEAVEEHSPMLALHFTLSGDPDRGYRYHHLAGDRAAGSYANREAKEHFRRAWDLIGEGEKDSEAQRKRLITAVKLAEVMEPLGEFEATLNLLEKFMNHPPGKEDLEYYARVYYWMGNTYGNLGRYDDARKHLFRSLELAQASANIETEGDAHNYLSQLDYLQGYLKQGLDHAQSAVQCQREIGKPFRLAWALIFKALILFEIKGRHEVGEILGEIKVWLERSGNDRARCLFCVMNSHSLCVTGQYEAAIKVALEGLEIAEKIGEGILKFFLLNCAAEAALDNGNRDSALSFIQRGISEGEKIGHPLGLAILRLSLARILLLSGKVEESMEHAEAALKFFQTLDMGHLLQRASEVFAEVLANRMPLDETQIGKMIDQAAALVERSGSPWHKIEHLGARARISLKRGNLADARKTLLEARSLCKEVGLEGGTGELRALEEALEEEALEKEEAKGGPVVR